MPASTDLAPCSPDIDESTAAPVSRRGFGRHLLGASAVAVLVAMGKRDQAQAAPLTDTWKLGGNSGVNTDGTNFLGTLNVAPLIFKVTKTAGSAPVERMRITPGGVVGIGTTAPAGMLHSKAVGTIPAIIGESTSTGSNITGVLGKITSTSPGDKSSGVHGVNNSTSYYDAGAGVRGSHAGSGFGVYGTSVNGPGVGGETPSTGRATGVLGRVTATNSDTHSAGVRGVNHGTNSKGAGVRGSHYGSGFGVYGTSENGPGVYGASNNSGVYGWGNTTGVIGATDEGIGVLGTSRVPAGMGVKGITYGDGTVSNAVYGQALGANNTGVYGEANNGTAAFGVYGVSESGFGVVGVSKSSYAGYFSGKVSVIGNLHVTGTLSKGGGSFKIDHPLAPDTKYLYHSFVESPDMMNIYNGNVTLDAKGEAVVTMPAWFEALNMEFRYQLTCIGRYGPVYVAEEITNNQFKIAGGQQGMKVSWMVTGIRQDAFANANRIPVEEDKSAEERGKYLHPKVHGKPESASVDAEHVKRHEKNVPQQRP